MREFQASEANVHLPQLLDEVERGETIAAYLELALREAVPLATLDKELAKAASAEKLILLG